MARFYKGAIKYDKVDDDGKESIVTENMVYDAESFGDCEEQAYAYAALIATGEFDVTQMRRVHVDSLIIVENGNDFMWEVEVTFIDVNDAGKEKKARAYVFINSLTTADAMNHVNRLYNSVVIPYAITSVKPTNILGYMNRNILAELAGEELEVPYTTSTAVQSLDAIISGESEYVSEAITATKKDTEQPAPVDKDTPAATLSEVNTMVSKGSVGTEEPVAPEQPKAVNSTEVEGPAQIKGAADMSNPFNVAE